MASILNIAAYHFFPLEDLPRRRELFRTRCSALNIRGTILLSPEGVNLFLAGEADSIRLFLEEFKQELDLQELVVKESWSESQPFAELFVKLKKEIIAFGIEGIVPAERTAPKISPVELKRRLDAGEGLILLDTRNRYETEVGSFAGAMILDLDHFRNFPKAVQQLPEEWKQQPIVMFCTGGIRCEKAGPFMQQAGFEQILQLDGGILNYFEKVGGDHWIGNCFVFDERESLDPNLQPVPIPSHQASRQSDEI